MATPKEEKRPVDGGVRQPLVAFVSYSHEDTRHQHRLEKALTLLQRQGYLALWSDRKLLPGERWGEEIDRQLARADLVLLLVSADFIASDYCWSVEMNCTLARHDAGEAVVVPVVVRPCDWHEAPFGRLQALPPDGRAVTSWPDEDEAWAEVARGLRRLVEQRAAVAPAEGGSRGGGGAGADPTRYLEALEYECSFVRIQGMGAQVAERLPLDRVYTRLRVAHAAATNEGEEPGRERVREDREWSRGGTVELPAVLRAHRSAVLVGDPGSGKTTFLRFAARSLARAWLGDTEAAGRDLGLEGELPFPLFLRLGELANFLVDHEDRELPEAAPEHLLRYADFTLRGHSWPLPADYLSRRLSAGDCLLLLDGLDEVPEAWRPRVAAIVERTVASGPRSNRHLITCRTRAYEGAGERRLEKRQTVSLASLPSFPLAPFEPAQVEEFVRSWSRALFHAPPGDASSPAALAAERHRRDLLETLGRHRHVRHLTRNPLMLTMLAVVYWNKKQLPEQRAELYDAAVEYLLSSRAEQSRFPSPLRREALQAMALAMFEDPEGVQRSIGLPAAARAVAPILEGHERPEGGPGGMGQRELVAFLEDEALHSGLLVSRSAGELEFWHLSFQEYLAALELAGRDWWSGIAPRLYDDRWNEVVLLLAGCLRRTGGVHGAARELLRKILAGAADRAQRARAVGLIGRILNDIRPYGGDPSLGTGFQEALRDTLAIFDPGGEEVEERVRVEVGEALGQTGDPRLVDPAALWVVLPGGTLLMGAQERDPEAPGYDEDAYDWEAEPHRVTVSGFRVGRFPVTVAEYRAFVEAAGEGYLDPRWWEPTGWAWREKEGHEGPGSWEEQRGHGNRPVTEVSWYEAAAYCAWRTAELRRAGGSGSIRLPTEAEWEYAARGRAGRRYPWGIEAPTPRHANFDGRVAPASPVGIYPLGATPEGVRDLAGNVLEWCGDWWQDSYPPGDQANPAGPGRGPGRVLRGGSWLHGSWDLRASFRSRYPPFFRLDSFGFRLVWSSSGAMEALPRPAIPRRAASRRPLTPPVKREPGKSREQRAIDTVRRSPRSPQDRTPVAPRRLPGCSPVSRMPSLRSAAAPSLTRAARPGLS